MNTPLDRLTNRLRQSARKEEAAALALVDWLMREYAFTDDDGLDEGAQALAVDLRLLVAEWILK